MRAHTYMPETEEPVIGKRLNFSICTPSPTLCNSIMLNKKISSLPFARGLPSWCIIILLLHADLGWLNDATLLATEPSSPLENGALISVGVFRGAELLQEYDNITFMVVLEHLDRSNNAGLILISNLSSCDSNSNFCVSSECLAKHE